MKEQNPWKTLSSAIVYKNPWISVREDQVLRPDGSPGIYGVVEAHIATGVMALTDESEIYLVGQFRYPTNVYSWEIIEGGTEEDETPLSAAKRELEEEAGLVASHWEELGGEFHLSNCISTERGFIYLAKGLSQRIAKPDVTEVLTVKKLPFKSVLKMVESGEIVDAVTIIAIYRAAKILGL